MDIEDAAPAQVESALARADFDAAGSLVQKYADLTSARLASAASSEEQHTIFITALARIRAWIALAKVMRSQFCAELTAASRQSSYGASLPRPNTLNLFG